MARQGAQKKNFDGIKSVAEMLGQMDKPSRDRLLKQLSARDPQMTEKIRSKMFVFEDIASLDKKDLQLFLREIPLPKLALSLRDTGETFKKTIYDNLSSRTAAILREEINNQGPQRVTLVRAAQEELIKILREMAAQGKISLHHG